MRSLGGYFPYFFHEKKDAWNDVASPAAKLLTVKKIMLKIDLTFWPIIAFEYDTPQQTFWVIISARPKTTTIATTQQIFPKLYYIRVQSVVREAKKMKTHCFSIT